MPFNINDFMAHYAGHKEYSKTSKFEVFIVKPPALALPSPNGLQFQCETSELPGYNINIVEGRVYGASYAVAATPVFNDLNLTFICAGDLWEKQFFDAWMDFILPKGEYEYLAKFRESYTANIEVRQFLETGEIAYRATFFEAFPTSVAPITLNWADDGINRLNVTFKYRHWDKS
jgi:hypothetical protein